MIFAELNYLFFFFHSFCILLSWLQHFLSFLIRVYFSTANGVYHLVSATSMCHVFLFLSQEFIFQQIIQGRGRQQRVFIISSRYSPLKQLYSYFEENAEFDSAANVIHLKKPMLWEVSVTNISDKTVTLEDVYHDSEGNLLGKNISVFAVVNFETRMIVPIQRHLQMKALTSPYYMDRIYLKEVQQESESSIKMKTLINPSDIDDNKHTNYVAYFNIFFKAFEVLGAPLNPHLSLLEVINKNESALWDELTAVAWCRNSAEYCCKIYKGGQTILSVQATYLPSEKSQL